MILLSISAIVFIFIVFIIGFYLVINSKAIDYNVLCIMFRILIGAGLILLLTLLTILILSILSEL